MMMGGCGGVTQFGKSFGVDGSNMEMWKTGCIARMLSGSRRVKETELT